MMVLMTIWVTVMSSNLENSSDLSRSTVILGFNRETNRSENFCVRVADKPVEVKVSEPIINLVRLGAFTRFFARTAEIVG
jgi:hypothetical protein